MSGQDGTAAHDEAQMLLPWYATGQLDEPDRCLVDAHLANCAACREVLAIEQAIERRVAGLSLDTELGWNDMRRRLEGRRMSERRSIGARIGHRPRWIGFALAAQMLILVTAIMVFTPVGRPASYHALSATLPPARGNALVMFRPDAKAEELMHALSTTGVRVVGGPTEAGAWIANVDPIGRADALARLRAQPAVTLAEPIDP